MIVKYKKESKSLKFQYIVLLFVTNNLHYSVLNQI